MTSTTSVLTMSSEDNKGEIGSAQRVNFNLDQILIPVICAGIIAAVIFVLACCLTKKKTKPLRGWRERSSHTIETSHDLSENGIYDVIDKVTSKNKSNDRNRRHDKLNSNCLFVCQNETDRNKTMGIYSTGLPVAPLITGPQLDSLLTPPIPPCTKHDWSKFDRTFQVHQGEEPPGPVNTTSTAKVEEECVYETLDRYWTLSNSFKRELNAQLSKEPVDGENGNYSPGSVQEVQTRTDITNAPLDPNSLPYSEKATNDKILCQLTLFHISESDDSSRQAESVYYYVNLQSLANGQGGNLPSVLQNARLQVVPGEEVNLKKSTSPNITLEPVDGALVPRINENSPLYSPSERAHKKIVYTRSLSKEHEPPSRANSKRNPKLLVKRSESFRDAHAELQAVKENYLNNRRQSDSSKPLNLTSTQPLSSSIAAEQIFKKLGPLPPLPQDNKLLRRTESDNTGGVRQNTNALTPEQKHTDNDSYKKRRLPPSPIQKEVQCFENKRQLKMSPTEKTFKRQELSQEVSREPTFSSFKNDASTNTAINEEPSSNYSHYFILESSDYSSGNEDNLDEKYLE